MSQYTIHVLFGQRKCAYEGQYAPEALEIADENAYDDNPEWLLVKKEQNEISEEFTAVAIVTITLPFEAIVARLNPKLNPITGVVAPEKHD
jgi:hypothetical protein